MRRLRRTLPAKQRNPYNAEWGSNDCWTHCFGDAPRPAILVAANDEHEAFENAVKYYGSVPALIEGIEGRMPDWKRIPQGASPRKGDVIIGATRESGFVMAKYDASYLPIERRRCGYATAHFIKVFGVWRADKCPR